MDDFRKAVRAVNLALRTVWLADTAKKIAIASATAFCGFLLFRSFRK